MTERSKSEPWRLAALRHATECFPAEACGLLIVEHGRHVFVPARNLATGHGHFILDPQDYAAAECRGEILAVVHSHPNLPPEPSEADRVACEASGLPWHIVSIPAATWRELKPSGYVAPLVGRTWSHGVLDCYALIRDWYRLERGIVLPDRGRDDEWWLRGQNLYLDWYERDGWRRINISDDKRPDEFCAGDVLLMQIGAPVPNHAAIWLGDGTILHHLSNRLSTRDVFGGYYRKHTTHVLRRASA